jgi:hypothetical protein
MSLKTENSRRVVKSRPVCMGLYTPFSQLRLASNLTISISQKRNYFVHKRLFNFETLLKKNGVPVKCREDVM